MGKTSSAVKNKWAAEHYTQIKIAVNPELAASFKALCFAEGTSVTRELSAFMVQRCGKAAAPKKLEKDLLSTRGGRRKLVKELTQRLEEVKDAEEVYISNIPINLQGSVRYETAEQSVSHFNDALDYLLNAYE